MSLRRKVMPSMRGISRSSVRTSGLRWTMRSRATKGSGAAPTTSISGSFASSREKIWRPPAESSTTRTRVTAPPCYLALRLLQPRSLLPPTHAQRQVDAVAVLVHHRARGGGGGQRALVLLARHLAHPRQSQAAGLLAEQLDDEGAGDHVQHLTHRVAVVPGGRGAPLVLSQQVRRHHRRETRRDRQDELRPLRPDEGEPRLDHAALERRRLTRVLGEDEGGLLQRAAERLGQELPGDFSGHGGPPS